MIWPGFTGLPGIRQIFRYMVPRNNWINTLGDLLLNLKPSELFQSCHRERYVAQFSHTFWFVMDVQRTCSRSTCSVDQVAESMPISVFLLIKTRNLLVTASAMTDRQFGACKLIRILSSCEWATNIDYTQLNTLIGVRYSQGAKTLNTLSHCGFTAVPQLAHTIWIETSASGIYELPIREHNDVLIIHNLFSFNMPIELFTHQNTNFFKKSTNKRQQSILLSQILYETCTNVNYCLS